MFGQTKLVRQNIRHYGTEGVGKEVLEVLNLIGESDKIELQWEFG
jgi:hypothetical protein